MRSITAIVLTLNEAAHLPRCLGSLSPVVERMCVVDSGSTDDTLKTARRLGAEVFVNTWVNHAAQFNWALDHCAIRSEWVLRLDADEFLEPALQAEIRHRIGELPDDCGGVYLKRKYYFLGRWVRFGGMNPVYSLRLWRYGRARIEPRWMDEHAVLLAGRSTRFRAAFIDDNRRDLTWWSEKHIRYATLEAVQVTLEQLGMAERMATTDWSYSPAVIRKRFVKNRIYHRLPLGLGPCLYLLYRLIVRMGILDGAHGIAFHALQGFWYRLLVDLRRRELAVALAGIKEPEQIRRKLESLTGLKIGEFQAIANRPNASDADEAD